MLTAKYDRTMSAKRDTFYIDDNTRLKYRFAASLLGNGHVLERRRRVWIFSWWSEVASLPFTTGGHFIEDTIDKLLRKEKGHSKDPFSGYPDSPIPRGPRGITSVSSEQ